MNRKTKKVSETAAPAAAKKTNGRRLRTPESPGTGEVFLRRILESINQQAAKQPLLDAMIALVQDYMDCEAVGIRLLDEQGNIPYQAYTGFSDTFYETESPLSIRSDQCMCINVITGDINPALPCFTEGGSFFINGTTQFLATVSEQDKGKTRNVCNAVGYESVALVPIRYKDRIIGLIHVADSRNDKVPKELVESLELVSIQLGNGIARIQAEEALLNDKLRFQGIVENTLAGYFRIGFDGCFQDVNKAWLDMHGYASADEVIGQHFSSTQVEQDLEQATQIVNRLIGGQPGMALS